jgi:stringent starvation protein B
MTQLLPPKKEVALALLERSNVDVYLDPRAKGVVVPPQFRKEPRLILKIGLNMPVPIPDLRLDDESMSCTLSFNRAKFYCVVPWLSVFAMVGDDGRGMVWPDDVPKELAVRVVDDRRPGATPVPARDGAEPAPASSRGGSRGKSRIHSSPRASEHRPGEPRASEPRASEPLPGEPRESERGDVASDRGQRRGRPKKKKEEATRPVLVAVPSPEKSAPQIEKLDERRDAPERAPATPRVSAADARERPPPSARPKRELPPYLRVVK